MQKGKKTAKPIPRSTPKAKGRTNLLHLAGKIFDTPLMIHPAKMEVILQVLAPRFELDVTDAVDLEAEIRTPRLRMGGYTPIPRTQEKNICVVPVCGTLMNRAMGLQALSGLCSYQALGDQIDALVADPSCAAIVLEFDSPGGEVPGVFDLSDKIYKATKEKPIYAIVNEQCFSAAYALASSCTKIFVPRTGNVGSIGVIGKHVDQSSYDEKQGFKYTNIFAGEYKTDLDPHKPITDGAMQRVQAQVDVVYALFVNTVARGRDLTAADVKGTKAGMFMGKSAVTAGLADAVMSTDDAMQAIADEVLNGEGAPTPAANSGVTTIPVVDDRGDDEEEEPIEATASRADVRAAGDNTTDLTTQNDQPTEEELQMTPEEIAKLKADAKAEGRAEADAEHTTKATAAKKESDDALKAEQEKAEKIKADNAEITRICAIAGQPKLAVEFIKDGLSLEAAKSKLFDKTAGSEPTVHTGVDTTTGGQNAGADPAVLLMKAAATELQKENEKAGAGHSIHR